MGKKDKKNNFLDFIIVSSFLGILLIGALTFAFSVPFFGIFGFQSLQDQFEIYNLYHIDWPYKNMFYNFLYVSSFLVLFWISLALIELIIVFIKVRFSIIFNNLHLFLIFMIGELIIFNFILLNLYTKIEVNLIFQLVLFLLIYYFAFTTKKLYKDWK